MTKHSVVVRIPGTQFDEQFKYITADGVMLKAREVDNSSLDFW